MPILDQWKLIIKDLPAYASFKGIYEEVMDAKFMDYMLEQDRWKPEHRALLVKFRNRLSGNTNKIGHYQPKGVGRFYADEDASIINLPRRMKHTIMKKLGWIDFDLIKSHPSIVVEVGKKTNRRFEAMEHYISDFATIIARGLDYYSDPDDPLDEDDIKDYYNGALNGGTLKGWIYTLAHPKRGGTPKPVKAHTTSPEFQAYADDCKRAIDIIYHHNPELVDKVKGDLTDEEAIKRRTISYWCGAVENDIINTAYKWAVGNRIVSPRKNVALEYDGICFKPEDGERNWAEIVSDINAHIQQKTGLAVRGKFKDYTKIEADLIDGYAQTIIRPPTPTVIANLDDGVEEYENAETYADFKRGFEKSHCKVINQEAFYKIKRNVEGIITEVKIFGKVGIITAYEHLTYETDKGHKAFILDWLSDRTIRKYDDVDTIAPPMVCPPRVYNLWTPFRIEQLYDSIILPEADTTEYEELKEKAIRILGHINIVCSQNKEISDYLIWWIAQSLKYPAFKTTAPCLISKEGAGKGTIIKVIKKLMGDSKVLETASPKEYVWGHFNELMLNAYFVSLNEMDIREQAEAEGKIKMLIKDPDLQINPKGKGHMKVRSNHRFWVSSNNLIPIKSGQDDRRNCIIRLSDELLTANPLTKEPVQKNIDYFVELNAIIDDDRVIKILYDALMGLPDLDTFHTKPQPITKYQQLIQTGNNDPIGDWIVHFTREHWYQETIEILASEMTARFKDWRDSHNFKYECSSTSLMRNIGIYMIQYPDGAITTASDDKSLHKARGNATRFNITIMKTHLGLIDPPTELVAGGGGPDELDEESDGFGDA